MARKTLTYTIHGIDAMNDRVDAGVFARKLGALVAGLTTADKERNGKKSFDYIITDLGIGSAHVRLDAVERRRHYLEMSNPITAFDQCVGALERSDFDAALSFGGTVEKIASLCEGSGRAFSHAELVIDDNVIRIDDFLSRQAANAQRHRDESDASIKQFVGVSVGSFDGTIKELDLRGTIPTCKLILSAGGMQIDCISKTLSVEQLKATLNRRAWVEGRAVYGGGAGLPERLEIANVDFVDVSGDASILQWKGSFKQFDVGQIDLYEAS